MISHDMFDGVFRIELFFTFLLFLNFFNFLSFLFFVVEKMSINAKIQ